MPCTKCKHDNPAGARFCNHCGAPQQEVVDEETSVHGPLPLRIPTEVRGTSIRLHRSVFQTVGEAQAAMSASGFEVQQGLTRTVDIDGLGAVTRLYGVLINGFSDEEEATDTSNPLQMLRYDPNMLVRLNRVRDKIYTAVERRLADPDNDRVREKLERGRLKYVPCNDALVRSLEGELSRCGLHVPWSMHGFDGDLGRACARELRPFGFVCYYTRLGLVHRKNGEPCFVSARMASNPFGMDVMHSWVPPIHDSILDEDVGLLVEAIARA